MGLAEGQEVGLNGYRARLNHRVRLWTTRVAVIATGIIRWPSDSCDCYRGRRRTFKLAVIATRIR